MSRMAQFSRDDAGFPVIELAEVANSGATTIRKTGSKGGNKAHDSRSGKFAPAAKEATDPAENPPANTNPLEWKRMLDAARDAAREMDMPQEGDIREFLEGRAKNPGQVDIPGFLALVQEQKISDLVDLIDQAMRQSGVRPIGRRRVRVVSPKGYVRRAFGQLKEDGVAELMHRLESKGHSEEDVEAFVLGRRKEEEREPIKEKKKALAASDEIDPGSWWATADELDDLEEGYDEEPWPVMTAPQQPDIHITLAPQPAQKMKVTPVRGDDGLIAYTVQEPVEDASAA